MPALTTRLLPNVRGNLYSLLNTWRGPKRPSRVGDDQMKRVLLFCGGLTAVTCSGPATDLPPTVLPEVVTNLGTSDVGRAHTVLDPVVQDKKAAPEEYALSAFTYLMTVNQSCPEAAQAISDLNVTFNPSVDLFGGNGWFARASRDGTNAAGNWFSDYIETANQNSGLNDSTTGQVLVDAAVQLSICADEAARRLQLAFDATEQPKLLEVTLPKGLFFADEDVIVEAPELKIMQGGLRLAAGGARMLSAFDWSALQPFGDRPSYDANVAQNPAAEMSSLVAKRDALNSTFFVVQNGDRLRREKDTVLDALATIREAIEWAAENTTDGRGLLHMARLNPRSAAMLLELVTMTVTSIDGPALVPATSAPLNLNLSGMFSGNFSRGEFEPYEIDEDDPSYVALYGVNQFWPSMINSYFDKRILEEFGMPSDPAEVSLGEYSEADQQQVELAAELFSPFSNFVERNWP